MLRWREQIGRKDNVSGNMERKLMDFATLGYLCERMLDQKLNKYHRTTTLFP